MEVSSDAGGVFAGTGEFRPESEKKLHPDITAANKITADAVIIFFIIISLIGLGKIIDKTVEQALGNLQGRFFGRQHFDPFFIGDIAEFH